MLETLEGREGMARGAVGRKRGEVVGEKRNREERGAHFVPAAGAHWLWLLLLTGV